MHPMSDSLDKPLTSTDLNRLDLAALVRYGNQALQAGQYRRAVSLLREAVKRAPFRQDIKEALAAAIEGASTLRAEPDIQEIRPQDSVLAPRKPVQPDIFQRDDDEPEYPRQARQRREPARIEEFDVPTSQEPPPRRQEPPERQSRFAGERQAGQPPARRPEPAPQPPASSGRPIAFGRRPGAAHRTEPARRPKPAQFMRRHNRGPISALLLMFVVGLVFVAVAAAGIYYYMNRATAPGENADSVSPAQNYESQYETAANFKKQMRYSEALDVLMKLDPTMRRDHALAEIYRDQVQVSPDAKPQVLESAIESLKEAVKYDPQNADYGNLLGEIYYALGRKYQPSNAAAGRANLENAKNAYQSVLQQNPGNLKALLQLGDTAGALGDAVTQAECYRSIIRIDPNSAEAVSAKRNLQSLGYRQ